MSRATMGRLGRLEATTGPKVLGYWHVIYARNRADFEAQRAQFISSGHAKPNALILDERLADDEPAQEPETFPETKTHEEWVNILSRPEGQQ